MKPVQGSWKNLTIGQLFMKKETIRKAVIYSHMNGAWQYQIFTVLSPSVSRGLHNHDKKKLFFLRGTDGQSGMFEVGRRIENGLGNCLITYCVIINSKLQFYPKLSPSVPEYIQIPTHMVIWDKNTQPNNRRGRLHMRGSMWVCEWVLLCEVVSYKDIVNNFGQNENNFECFFFECLTLNIKQ